MHEVEVVWDFVALWRQSGSLMQGFLWYGFAVACLGFVRAAVLGRRVLALPGRKRVSIRAGSESVEELAAAGLKGRLTDEPVREFGGEGASSARPDEKLHALRRTNLVETEFSYRWEMSLAKAQATERLARLTFLMSIAMAAWEGAYSGYLYFYVAPSQIGDIAGGPWDFVYEIAATLFISAFLYAIASFFEGILAKRRAKWNYLRARIADEAAAGNGI